MEDWRERFDKEFYQNAKGVWISRGGESYGSIRPEMGRGELFRFFSKEIERVREDILARLPKIHACGGDYQMNDDYYRCQGRNEAINQIRAIIKSPTPPKSIEV